MLKSINKKTVVKKDVILSSDSDNESVSNDELDTIVTKK
jgi:hypothetical protein